MSVKKRPIKKKKYNHIPRKKINLSKYRIPILIISLILIGFIVYQNQGISGNTTNTSYLNNREKITKEPVFAGKFYPEKQENLELTIQTFLDMAPDKKLENVRALILPHAGYIYSGEVAAFGYKQILDKEYKNIFIIAQSHTTYFDEASILNVTHYKTPFGEIEVSKIAQELLDIRKFYTIEEAHEKEHSIEVQIPFIQHTQPNAKIIPIVLGQIIDVDYMVEELEKYITSDNLFIVSTDLSHYKEYETAKFFDNETITNLLNKNQEGINYCEACGKNALLILNKLAQRNSWEPILLDYRNSGDTAGKNNSVVGYTAIAYTSEKLPDTNPNELGFYDEIPREDREFLLALARDTIEAFLEKRRPKLPDESELSDILKSNRGCFVTLEKEEDLRGCIGSIPPAAKLYECVISNAANAAFKDSRFNPLQSSEFDEIDIEISKLSVPKKLEFTTSDELLEQLKPGIDGVIIKNRWNEATFLPQVWKNLPDKRAFLIELCKKGNMKEDCWKDKNIIVETYQAEVFSESDY
jgi:AmmeMemoRadiSam system protein B/AmmeMemoRadiSam system protein A